MKITHWLSAISLAVIITGASLIATQTQPLERSWNPPNHAYRNANGSFMRGIHNEVMSQNWSGYALTASGPYTAAQATWQVPSVTYDGGSAPQGWEYAASWIGIGGFSDGTLIQLGVSGQVATNGITGYNVWYELIPAGGTNLPFNVHPGDILTASLQCTGGCSPGAVQTWLLSMSDQPAGWTWSQSFQYQSSMASAEFIMEAPFGSGGELPLANFNVVTFNPVTANGQNPNLTLAANGITMQDPAGETSNPAEAINGNSFSICWGYGSMTPCTTNASFTPPPPPAPIAHLGANPAKITSGQSATLTWSSTNATACTGDGFTAAGISGSAVVSPIVTTPYSINCTGNGGVATATTTVNLAVCHGKKCKP